VLRVQNPPGRDGSCAEENTA